jgi:hypothetical protein
VRAYVLTTKGRLALDAVRPEERPAVARTFASLLDPRVPLVRPGQDVSITHGSAIMGRAVPGTKLVLCYVPFGEVFYLVNITRAP